MRFMITIDPVGTNGSITGDFITYTRKNMVNNQYIKAAHKTAIPATI